ncbi:Rhomboid-like protein [Melia azedarach]|uniref:Rhomboid-like protein n=1 Tax=Melia azedarach TaxID=155640 RepID=A0ACC1X240_MELAZ|nr:Rhomboid-like protein [Melia azedarach]
MAAKEPPPEILIRVNSRGGSNTVHPVEIDPPQVSAPATVAYREMKHFKKWVAWLIPCFVIANIIMFVITMYVNNCPKNSVSCIVRFLGRFSFQPFKENPLLGPSSITLQKMGALDVGRVVDKHQGWRLLSCNWLHGGVFHIVANMLSLLVIGIRLEQEFGFVRVGLLYIISGFGEVCFQRFSYSQISLLVLLVHFLDYLEACFQNSSLTGQYMLIRDFQVAALLTLVIIIAINLAVGILPHVDNFAHIGGFASGFLLGFVFLIRPQFGWVAQRYGPAGYSSSSRPKFKIYQCVLWIVSLILVIVGLTVGLILLLRGVDANDHCSWCHYLSCVPTSSWSCKTEPASCLSTQTGTQLNVTCLSNGKSSLYMLSNPSNSQIQGICTSLCS